MRKRVLGIGLILLVILTLAGLILADTSTHLGVTDRTADQVLGQAGFLGTYSGTSDTLVNSPYACAFDRAGSLWVADAGNNRVLKYSADTSAGTISDTTADLVIGQAGFGVKYSGTSDTMLSRPVALAFDPAGNLYVQDCSNNRVLRFNAAASGLVTDTTADLVIGQAGFGVKYLGRSDTQISPEDAGLAIDDSGNLYVAEYSNSRISRFNAGETGIVNDTTIDLIFGQAGPFAAYGGASDSMFAGPEGICFDASGNMYVSSYESFAVYKFTASNTGVVNDTTADLVFGQVGFLGNTSGVSSTKMGSPYGLQIDLLGNLWVADYGNDRILRFNAGSNGMVTDTTADFVIGGGDPNAGFDSSIAGASDTMVWSPLYMAFDSTGRLYVPDNGNHRILVFASTIITISEDDNCFIATAAYGEKNDALASFHQFRDGVLMQSRLGRGFVQAYYEFGPKAASMVTTDASKFAARMMLTPVLGFARLANLLGMIGALTLLTLTAGGVFILSKRGN